MLVKCSHFIQVSPELPKSKPPTMLKQNSVVETKPKPEAIKEDVKENEVVDAKGHPTYAFERLITTSTDPVTDIDVTKREVCVRE